MSSNHLPVPRSLGKSWQDSYSHQKFTTCVLEVLQISWSYRYCPSLLICSCTKRGGKQSGWPSLFLYRLFCQVVIPSDFIVEHSIWREICSSSCSDDTKLVWKSTLLLFKMLKLALWLWWPWLLFDNVFQNTIIFSHSAEVICLCFCSGHCNNIHCLAKAINQIAAALFTIHKGSIEDRLKEFLAVCMI